MGHSKTTVHAPSPSCGYTKTHRSVVQFSLVTSDHVDFSSDQTINVSFGLVNCDLGLLDFTLTRWGSHTSAKDTVDVCMAVELEGSSHVSPAKVTFVLQATHYATVMCQHGQGVRPESRQAPVVFGPATTLVTRFRKGAVTRATFPLHDVLTKQNVLLDQLSVTIEALDSLSSGWNSGRFPLGRALVSTINVPTLCDCAIALADEVEVCASRAVLAHASPSFFGTMFRHTEWTEASQQGQQVVKFQRWTIKSFWPCLVHMYSGWRPDDNERLAPLPPGVAKDWDKYSLLEWQQALHLAQMLELSDLVDGIKTAMVGLLLDS